MLTTQEALQNTDLDIEQIRRLTHDYSWAIDNSQLDDLVGLFVEDAVFDLRGFGAPVESRGRKEILAGFAALVDGLSGCVHLTMNHLIDVDGDNATGTIYCHAFVANKDGSRAENLVLYTDSYLRTADGWKFRSRAANPLLPAAPSTNA